MKNKPAAVVLDPAVAAESDYLRHVAQVRRLAAAAAVAAAGDDDDTAAANGRRCRRQQKTRFAQISKNAGYHLNQTLKSTIR